MAQAGHETGLFTKWVEDLTYKTAERLPVVWPKRFTMNKEDKTKLFAPDYTFNPEKLANAVYASRYGNGDTASGDGWKFRWRGAFHLTIREHYLAATTNLYQDTRLITNPDLVATDWDARWGTAGWFWANGNFNMLADADQFTQLSTKIQGDASTVPKRLEVLKRANAIFVG